MFHLYEHWRTDTNVPFYVGKGNDERISYIERDNKRHKTICSFLERNGYAVDVRIIFSTENEKEALIGEVADIAAYREAGIVLCNETGGGEGVSGYCPSEDIRAAQSARATAMWKGPNSHVIREAQSKASRAYQLNRWNGEEGEANRSKQSELSKKFQESRWSGPESDVYREIARKHGREGTKRFFDSPEGALAKEKISLKLRGENGPNAKIDEVTAQKILDFSGSIKDAARIFNCTEKIARKIKSRATWKHLIPSSKPAEGIQK